VSGQNEIKKQKLSSPTLANPKPEAVQEDNCDGGDTENANLNILGVDGGKDELFD